MFGAKTEFDFKKYIKIIKPCNLGLIYLSKDYPYILGLTLAQLKWQDRSVHEAQRKENKLQIKHEPPPPPQQKKKKKMVYSLQS